MYERLVDLAVQWTEIAAVFQTVSREQTFLRELVCSLRPNGRALIHTSSGRHEDRSEITP